MFVPGTFIIVLASCSMANGVLDDSRSETSPLQNFFSRQLPSTRPRRSQLYLYGKSAINQGREAMKFLLDGAIRLSPGPSLNYREFVKHGGIRQAVADFHALRPNDIQEAMQPVMVPARVGWVGDRRVYISTGGKTGKATVTVIKPSDHVETQVDKFIYLD